MARLILLVVLAFCGMWPNFIYVATEQLPPLWDDSDLDDALQSAGLYRIVSEIHLDDNKDSYLVEEWLDGPSQLFRMDVLNLHDPSPTGGGDGGGALATTGGTKRTLLVSGATSERHLIEPFRCSSLDDLTRALGLNLGTKFPRHGHPLALAGVGALWLFAMTAQPAAGAEQAVFKAAKMPANGTSGNKRTLARTMRTFDMFEVPVQRGSEFPYKIRFYFLPDEWRSPEGKLNHNALVSVHLMDPSPSVTRIRLSARVLAIDVGLRSLPGVTSNLFELPLGYGCTRHGLETVTLRDDYKPPSNCFDDTAPRPHVCNIEVVSYLPHESGEDLDRWAVHTSSLRLVSGQLLGRRRYLTLEERDMATPPGVAASTSKRSVLRRSKRIWDLGAAPLEGGEYSERYAVDPPPMYFELSDHLRECRAYGNAQLDELPSLEFALNNQPKANASESHESLVGLSLVDERSMRELFRDTTGYHLMRELAAPWPRYREMHHEKRIDRFELRDRSGQVGWSGVASLVRRWYMPETRLLESDEGQTDAPAESLAVRLTIYLFESSGLADGLKQIGRLQLTMSAGLQVDEAYLHRELDLGPCLAIQPPDNLAFRLTYPLDAPETQVLALRSDYVDQIYAKFLEIIGQKLLAASQPPALEFHVMQLSELQVDVESNLIAVSGRLNKWPEVFNYVKWPVARFAESKASRQLVLMMRELKPTCEQCAQSCSHYSCPLFVYDQPGKRCHLYQQSTSSARWLHEQEARAINGSSQQRQQQAVGQPLSALEYDTGCAVYERRREVGWASRAATPRQMVERMNDWLERELGNATSDGSDDSPAARANPLALELTPLRAEDRVAVDEAHKQQSERLVLVPSSLHVGIGDLRAKVNLLLGRPGQSRDYEERESNQNKLDIKAEFEILFKSRKFKAENFHRLAANDNDNKGVRWFPLEEANSVENQWECELLCREHDCRSYSYCQTSRKCMVSKLHTQSAIEAASEKASFCLLLAREYLSKFDKLESLVGGAQEISSLAGSGPRLSLELDTARDCAISCMEAQEFTCRSFVLCPHERQIGCHLFGERNPLAARAAPTEPTLSRDNSTPNDAKCDLYQRSFLVDYQQFYGKQLDASKSGQSIRLLRGLAAEDCASACSQAVDNEDDDRQQFCGAFHVCLNSPGQGKRHQLLCGLQMHGFNESEQAFTPILQDEPNCSAFVPYSSGRGAALSSNESAIGHSPSRNQGEMSTTSSSHSLALSLFVILMGLATGYALTWLIALQNLVTYPSLLVQSMRSGV